MIDLGGGQKISREMVQRRITGIHVEMAQICDKLDKMPKEFKPWETLVNRLNHLSERSDTLQELLESATQGDTIEDVGS